MSNEISRVYQFLASFNKDGKDWKDVADSNDDGFVIKAEFRTLMEDFDWNGETSKESKNDLINQFWKTIDTNKSTSKIGTSKIRNANALDNKEVESMEYRITGYEKLNNYIANLNCPSLIKDKATWKQKINESLLSKVEEYLNTNKPIEELDAYLNEIGNGVQNMTTADMFADQYINGNEIQGILKQYNYVYDKDTELYEIISNFVKNIPADATANSIQETVINIVDAYLATAGLRENKGNIDLSQYGYEVSEHSGINEIQKSVLTKVITDNLAAIKNEPNYEKYKDVYDKAIADFINNTVDGASYSDFENLKNVGINEFKADDSYKNIGAMIVVKDVFASEDLKKAIANAVTDTFANKIISAKEGEIPVYDEIVDEAIQKAINGDFDKNGAVDKTKLQEWVVNEIKLRLTEFYPNNLEGVELSDMNPTYDALVYSADAKSDTNKHKEIALSYCTVISARGSAFADAVKEVFGDFKTTISNMTTGEIEQKMTILKTKIMEIHEISTYTVANWGNIPNDVSLGVNKTRAYALDAVVNDKESRAISSAKITYKVDGQPTSGSMSVKGGAAAGTVNKVNVEVLVNGINVGTKTITVTTIDMRISSDSIQNVKNWSGTAPNGVTVMREARGNDVGTAISRNDFDDLYNNNQIICLGFYKDDDKYNWTKSGKDEITKKLMNLGSYVVNTLAASIPNVDKDILQKAMERVVQNKYAINPTGDYCQKKNSGKTPANFFNYMKDNKEKVQDGLVQLKDTDGNDDSNIYGLYFKGFVDAIIAEYNSLV